MDRYSYYCDTTCTMYLYKVVGSRNYLLEMKYLMKSYQKMFDSPYNWQQNFFFGDPSFFFLLIVKFNTMQCDNLIGNIKSDFSENFCYIILKKTLNFSCNCHWTINIIFIIQKRWNLKLSGKW